MGWHTALNLPSSTPVVECCRTSDQWSNWSPAAWPQSERTCMCQVGCSQCRMLLRLRDCPLAFGQAARTSTTQVGLLSTPGWSERLAKGG
eukprot:2321775-Amphidinium_carterae.1